MTKEQFKAKAKEVVDSVQFENTTLCKFDEESTDYSLAYRAGIEAGKKQAIEEIPELANKENEIYNDGYNNALEDVNHAIDVIKDMTGAEFEEYFEEFVGIDDVVCGTTMQGIIRRTKAYEEKKKAEEEPIEVGDEVIYLPNNIKLYVIAESSKRYKGIYRAGNNSYFPISICDFDKNECKKTGRHIDEISQLLDKLRGEEG